MGRGHEQGLEPHEVRGLGGTGVTGTWETVEGRQGGKCFGGLYSDSLACGSGFVPAALNIFKTYTAHRSLNRL